MATLNITSFPYSDAMQPIFPSFLQRQIPIMILLSIFPGPGYIFLGWLYDLHRPAIFWYLGILLMSAWGYHLYRAYNPKHMSRQQCDRWYRQLLMFNYLFFMLWSIIFIIYADEVESKLHYIAIFTQLGASTVAAVLLFPEPRLFKPLIPFQMGLLSIYFLGIGELYSYILAVFSLVFAAVLYYSASNSYRLLVKTQHQATHDTLTGLPNRLAFSEQLQQTINTIKIHGKYSYLMLIDLDYFKTVNDSLGHDLGDKLLQEVSIRLTRSLPADNTLARLGGDEFIITGNEIKDYQSCQNQAKSTARDILDKLKETYIIQGHHIHISASIGIRLIQTDETSSTHLMREADIAMYEAKSAGRDGIFLFTKEMSSTVEQHLKIERRLHFALEKNEISLHYQPQVNSIGHVIGAECLVRWNSAKHGQVPPNHFIPVAEKTGLIIELGDYIITTAFQTIRNWHKAGIHLQQLSINISVRQFMHHDFIARVKHLCAEYLNDELCKLIIFEITESLVVNDVKHIIDSMQELQKTGIRFSMDDFGTGYSSLSSLKKLPVDEIKIDRSFINKLDSDASNQAMTITILNIAQLFNLTAVAEGVEDEAQFNFLREHHCALFQGYYIARPMPESEFITFYNQRVKQITT